MSWQDVCLSVKQCRSSYLRLSVYLLCSYANILLVHLNVRLSFCCMFVYISLYTCPFARLFVRLSHVGILSTPLNISAIFTARRISIARTMPWQHVCPTARPSVYLTLRPSIIRQASRPAHMNFCLLFVSVFQYTCLSITFIRTMSSIYVCVCYIRAPSSQYVSVCLAVHSSKFRQCL